MIKMKGNKILRDKGKAFASFCRIPDDKLRLLKKIAKSYTDIDARGHDGLWKQLSVDIDLIG